jgi:hypothetical protein
MIQLRFRRHQPYRYSVAESLRIGGSTKGPLRPVTVGFLSRTLFTSQGKFCRGLSSTTAD